MIVRRVRALPNAQSELFPAWFHYPFATNRSEAIGVVEAEHRQHAVVELVIRDLKDQALAHFPSGQFAANSAWTVIAALAHNLLRWTDAAGLPEKTVRSGPHNPPATAGAPRPPDPPRPAMDAAPPRPMALQQDFTPHSRASARSHPPPDQPRPGPYIPKRTSRPPGPVTAAPQTPAATATASPGPTTTPSTRPGPQHASPN